LVQARLAVGWEQGSPLRGMKSARLLAAARLPPCAGGVAAKESTVSSSHIQAEVWNKILSNMAFNPLSALTRATTDRIVDDPFHGSETSRKVEGNGCLPPSMRKSGR